MFFALCPDARLRKNLHSLAKQYHTQCGGRIIPEENIHLTLLFLGEVEQVRLASLQQSVSGVSVCAFVFELQQFSCWRHNRIGYAAPVAETAALEELSGALHRATASAGIQCDERAFKPHVTLLRNIRQAIVAQPMTPLEWAVESFSLMESVQTERGVSYRVLRSWSCHFNNSN